MPVKGPAAMPESLLVCYSTLARVLRPIALAAYTGHSEAAQRQQGSRGPPKIIPAQKEPEWQSP